MNFASTVRCSSAIVKFHIELSLSILNASIETITRKYLRTLIPLECFVTMKRDRAAPPDPTDPTGSSLNDESKLALGS